MFNKLRQAIIAASAVDSEALQLLKFIDRIELKEGSTILDVGCGLGGRLTLLKSRGLNASGVDLDAQAIEKNRRAGFEVFHPDKLKPPAGGYDAILMSHVIEHLAPGPLLEFLDHYLAFLKTGGHLIICTPLLTSAFFNDFDHVKPYHPTGIQMVLCESDSQVQYHSKNRLSMVDIWFKKSPLRIDFARGLYAPGYWRAPFYVNLALRLVHRLSFGLVSQKNAWMGVYKKG